MFCRFFSVHPWFGAVVVALSLPGCDRGDSVPSKTQKEPVAKTPASDVQPAAQPTVSVAPPEAPKPVYWSSEMLHKTIKYHNPHYTGNGEFQIHNGKPVGISLRGSSVENLRFMEKIDVLALDLSESLVRDLGPLRGKSLVELYLEDTGAVDLTPLRGLPLEKLYLSRTPVRDLSALAGMPLVELNAVATQVADLTPLATCANLQMLWLTDCPVEDITPLAKLPLVSLTLHRTKVKNLTPLAGSRLQRLHIGETPVSDLSPLAGMNLSRLVFTPDHITSGLSIVRNLPLREIGTRFDEDHRELSPPGAFWAKFDSASSLPAKDPPPP